MTYMAVVPRFGAARTCYQNIDLTSRIEGASPQGLVAILFDELTKALEAMAAAARRNDFGLRGSKQSRALSILYGLESSLDFESGGEIALSLAAVYREVRRLTIDGGRDNDPERLLRARDILQEIASAWNSLA